MKKTTNQIPVTSGMEVWLIQLKRACENDGSKDPELEIKTKERGMFWVTYESVQEKDTFKHLSVFGTVNMIPRIWQNPVPRPIEGKSEINHMTIKQAVKAFDSLDIINARIINRKEDQDA